MGHHRSGPAPWAVVLAVPGLPAQRHAVHTSAWRQRALTPGGPPGLCHHFRRAGLGAAGRPPPSWPAPSEGQGTEGGRRHRKRGHFKSPDNEDGTKGKYTEDVTKDAHSSHNNVLLKPKSPNPKSELEPLVQVPQRHLSKHLRAAPGHLQCFVSVSAVRVLVPVTGTRSATRGNDVQRFGHRAQRAVLVFCPK